MKIGEKLIGPRQRSPERDPVRDVVRSGIVPERIVQKLNPLVWF